MRCSTIWRGKPGPKRFDLGCLFVRGAFTAEIGFCFGGGIEFFCQDEIGDGLPVRWFRIWILGIAIECHAVFGKLFRQ